MPRECRNTGCTADARERSSYCSTECRDDDSPVDLHELTDPDADPWGDD